MMKRSDFLIPIKTTDNNVLIVNSLNGKMAKMTIEEYQNFYDEDIETLELKVKEDLKRMNFIVESDTDEIAQLHEIQDRIVNKSKEMVSAIFLLSYNCNFACPYCYEQANSNEQKILTEEMVDRILSIYEEPLQNIGFFGGEPFLPENMEIINYIISKNKNASYSAMTNGYYLEEYCSLLSTINTEFIQVTLDGPEEIHNKTRKLKNGQGTYKKIMRGIDKALSEDIHIKIRMNITQNNVEACIKLREHFVDKYKYCEELLSYELYPVFQLCEASKNEVTKKIMYSDFESREGHQAAKFDNTLASDLPIVNYFTTQIPLHPIVRFCDAHTNKRFYDPYGKIYSCILAVGKEAASIGTYYPTVEYKEESFIKRDVTKIKQCRDCKLSLLCGGGCPLKLINEGEGIMKPNCAGMFYALTNKLPQVIEIKENRMMETSNVIK